MVTEFQQVESERREIDQQLEVNNLKLEQCLAPTSIAFVLGATTRVCTQKVSPAREVLLREQRALIQRRNAIYNIWGQLRMKLNETK